MTDQSVRCPHCNVVQYVNPNADPRLAAMARLCWKCVKPLIDTVPDDLLPVDSEVFRLPDGGTIIGRDAYEAELVRRVFLGGVE